MLEWRFGHVRRILAKRYITDLDKEEGKWVELISCKPEQGNSDGDTVDVL
jgi:hypothetical protein